MKSLENGKLITLLEPPFINIKPVHHIYKRNTSNSQQDIPTQTQSFSFIVFNCFKSLSIPLAHTCHSSLPLFMHQVTLSCHSATSAYTNYSRPASEQLYFYSFWLQSSFQNIHHLPSSTSPLSSVSKYGTCFYHSYTLLSCVFVSNLLSCYCSTKCHVWY